MRPRKVDLASDWMRSQPRRAFHYWDEVWAALAELHSDEFAVSDDRKTPWFSLHRDMTQDACFFRGDEGLFELVEGAIAVLDVFERDGDVLRLTDDYQSKIKAHPGHLQNRGEKPYRVRLSQFLATFHGGQA
ncbi:hypothetical protein AB0N99_15950 [Streptomyces sp. NPDC093272]|uniref:hypothetical protein n=1 Tax=Streptomyces TaxID=1883 RepID=UPI003445D4B6